MCESDKHDKQDKESYHLKQAGETSQQAASFLSHQLSFADLETLSEVSNQSKNGTSPSGFYITPWRKASLKIFLGAAAGVGKTFAMLEQAQLLKKQGIDVVIGYVELHGRAETEKLLEGLEIVPRRQIEYRGRLLEEMDTPAIISRQPQVVLIDELAHTNAPGLEYAKRYEDIEEILKHSIDVYSTVNVQHLESLNDRVFELTHTRVRETFPDRILELAAELVLIDLPPEDLRDRIRQGKIYRPEKIDLALTSFFTTGNLAVLRELALRETADAVESSAAHLQHKELYEEELPTAQNFVLICVALKPEDTRVIRHGWRFARRLNAPAEVITVWKSDERKARDEKIIAPLRRLSRSLDLTFQELSGEPITLIIERARTMRATLLVIGESTRNTWQEWLFGTFTDKILRQLEGVDIYIVGDSARRR